MQIGFIGYSTNTNKLTDKLFSNETLSLSGIYSSKKIEGIPDEKVFDSPTRLIEESDILFIHENEAAFSICKEAIKHSCHIYFDSPFMFKKKEFDHLFHLSAETNTLIKFNQSILQKRIYTQAKKHLEPSILKFTIETNTSRNLRKILKTHLFNFICITRDNVKSGIRKTHYHPIEGKNGIPLTFSLSIIFDNGKTAELLFSQISGKSVFTIDSYQDTSNLHIDLQNNTACLLTMQNNEIKKREFNKANNQDKLVKDLSQFVSYLQNFPDKPLIVREENQHLVNLTHEFLEKIITD
jgi:hypothetical protein